MGMLKLAVCGSNILTPMTAEPELRNTDQSFPPIAAYEFDGQGGAKRVGIDELLSPRHGDNAFAFAWVHLQRDHPEVRNLLHKLGLDDYVVDALTAEETRPRCTVHGNGAVLNLRGVNLNPGAEPEDMISVRLWIEEKLVVGVWLRPLKAVREMFDAIERAQAPTTPGNLVAKLALRIANSAEPTVAALNERIDAMEEDFDELSMSSITSQLSETRRTAIALRRYMFPQRDALNTLQIEDLDWLTERDRSHIREAADRVTRLGEELEALRDRSQIIHELSMGQRAEIMNQQMLILSVVAAIFLPLSLVTGLLGMNVGGIPGAEDQWGFLIVCALLAVAAVLMIWLFRLMRLLR